MKLGATALLFVDVQNYSAEGGGEYAHLAREETERRYGYFFREMRERAVPNMRRLQRACRSARVEVMYTVIENLTADGRDRNTASYLLGEPLVSDYLAEGLDAFGETWTDERTTPV